VSRGLVWCISKVHEVALDLREPQAGSSLEHQAKKLDEVVESLESINDKLNELFDKVTSNALMDLRNKAIMNVHGTDV
jgi:hypothetical protein